MRGTVAAANARTRQAPKRITPACSWRVPGMKPGVSTSTTSGIPYASHVSTNLAPFCEDSASSTPPRKRGWLAITPTGRPSMRANAVTIERAQRGWTSSSEPASTIPAIASRTS